MPFLFVLLFANEEANASCAAYFGPYDGVSWWQQPTNTSRDGYSASGVYGNYTCKESAGHTYWSPDTPYVQGELAIEYCDLPWGGKIQKGQDVITYNEATVPYGQTCSQTVRQCSSGGLLTPGGSYQTCSVLPPPTCSLPWGGQIGNGSAVTAYASYSVPYGSTCQPQTRTCSNGSLSGSYSAQSCSVSPPANCSLPWGGQVANGSNVTAYAASTVPYGSTCQSQTRTCSNGSLTGSYASQSCSVSAPANCNVSGATWGSGGFCQASSATITHGETLDVFNSKTGAIGSATLTCSNGALSVAFPSCSTSITAPGALLATDGTVTGKITVTWAAAPGATGYDVQYRKVGDTTWTLVANASSGWQLPTTDESIYEFQVVGKNATGQGAWSETETGYIRKKVDPVFVSQSGIPAKIGVGQSFTYSQVWQNNGAETWTGGDYGTGPFNPADASVWGRGYVAYTGSTATGATVTTSISAVAPTTPGTYPLQRIMQKSGTSYGAASTSASVIVVGPPICTGVTPNVATTFNPNATFTVTLEGPSSVETASVRVWGEVQGEPSGASYPMTYNGSTWTATFPGASHLSPGETQINISAAVSNSFFIPANECAFATIKYEKLPLPTVTLEPTFGSFGDESRQGFVVNRQGGEFAKINVNLGSYNGTLKARVEVLDGSDANLIVAMNNVTGGQQVPVIMSSSTLSAVQAAWAQSNATVRVTYADASAAAQGKVVTIPIAWMTPPGGLTVTASGIQAPTATVSATLNSSGTPFSTATHGDFTGFVRVASSGTTTGGTVPVTAEGAWSISDLDYAQLHTAQLAAVARAVPPAGVDLIVPLEFTSPTFTLPVQAPVSVAATDGTLENDVQVVWPAIAPGSSIRYRVFRDGAEITPATGISALEILDTPPKRGTIYNYTVKTMINNIMSQSEATDPGHVPACRAARLIGASIDASMSTINGMVERWACLEGLTGSGQIDSLEASDIEFGGTNPQYRKFSYPLPENLADGEHTLRATLVSEGVTINGTRSYDIPFKVDRASITINNLTILYDGSSAQNGLEATSIGRFGVKMDGGSGIGFAEEVK